jgi:hypothetical protein
MERSNGWVCLIPAPVCSDSFALTRILRCTGTDFLMGKGLAKQLRRPAAQEDSRT